jgi:hypothetical protein
MSFLNGSGFGLLCGDYRLDFSWEPFIFFNKLTVRLFCRLFSDLSLSLLSFFG